jgi:hypothetical protein
MAGLCGCIFFLWTCEGISTGLNLGQAVVK